jgi:hypothetical protein
LNAAEKPPFWAAFLFSAGQGKKCRSAPLRHHFWGAVPSPFYYAFLPILPTPLGSAAQVSDFFINPILLFFWRNFFGVTRHACIFFYVYT